MTAEATRLERALADEQADSECKLSELQQKLQEAMLARRISIDEDCGDMSPAYAPHNLKHPLSVPLAESPMFVKLVDGDKDALFALLGMAARASSADAKAYAHARGAALAPQIRTVAPAIADAMEQLHKSRRPQRPVDASCIVTPSGDLAEPSEVELQRQALRRRMAKASKTTEAIESAAKALLNIVMLEDVSHGGDSQQPKRPALALAAASASTVALSPSAPASNAVRRGSTMVAQTSKRPATGSGSEDPLPIDLFLENQQRTDFISHATAAITALPPSLSQDFMAELMRQASCIGAGLAIAAEAAALLSSGDAMDLFYVQAAESLQRICRVSWMMFARLNYVIAS
jgi:hypothetical protein